MTELEQRLREALSAPLPGLEAQLRMAPQPRVGWDPYRVPEGLRDGAALILIYPGPSRTQSDLAAPRRTSDLAGPDRTSPDQVGPGLSALTGPRTSPASARLTTGGELRRGRPDPAGPRTSPNLAGPLRTSPDLTFYVPLTVRGSSLRNHTGQVSLPGGRVDPGESFETAAVREAAEEIGVVPASVRVLGRLTPLHIPVSGYLLHPIVGLTYEPPEFRLAEWEVARLLEVPLARLADASVVRRRLMTREFEGQTFALDVPYFAIEGEEVWGATAMVLAEFLAVLERTS